MIKEDYVSFEVAKLLKEKGFNIQCRAAYTYYGQLFTTQIQQYITNVLCSKGKLWDCTAPTLQTAMRWLRDLHHIAIVIAPSMFWGRYNISIYKKGNDYPFGFDGDSLIPSYEEAAEAAIKYCLENLI